MIFHENRMLADDFHVISLPYFCRKLGKMLQNLSSAAVVIGAFRVNDTLCLLVSSADNLCKQFAPRSGPTICRA